MDQRASGRKPGVEHQQPTAKTRSFIPDWLRFGGQESVPLPTTETDDSTTDDAPNVGVDDFQ